MQSLHFDTSLFLSLVAADTIDNHNHQQIHKFFTTFPIFSVIIRYPPVIHKVGVVGRLVFHGYFFNPNQESHHFKYAVYSVGDLLVFGDEKTAKQMVTIRFDFY